MKSSTLTLVASICFWSLFIQGSRGQTAYQGFTELASPNFTIASGSDAAGRINVTANWNTASRTSPDYFIGASGTAYNITIDAAATLYSMGPGNVNDQFGSFLGDDQPTGGTFSVQDPATNQITPAQPHNVSAANLQTAIRTYLSRNWSTCTVTNSGSPYTVTNGIVGAELPLVVNCSSLLPAGSLANTVELQAGSTSQAERQLINLECPRYFITVDGVANASGAVTLSTLVTNNGVIGTVQPPTGYNQSSEIAYVQNGTFINNGIMGFFPNDIIGDDAGPALAFHLGPNGTFINNGRVDVQQGPYTGQTIQSATEINYGIINTKLGACFEGAGLMDNHFTGVFNQILQGDSYAFENYGGTSAADSAVSDNWGIVNAWTEGVYMSHPYSIFNDYGGPLEPGQLVRVAQQFYMDMAFGGSVGADYNSAQPLNHKNCFSDNGGFGAAVEMGGAYGANTRITNLYNTIYTITSSVNNYTTTGFRVNYLPLIYGDVAGLDYIYSGPQGTSNQAIVNFYLDGVRTSDFTPLSQPGGPTAGIAINQTTGAVVINSGVYDNVNTPPVYAGTTYWGMWTIAGAPYSVQNVGTATIHLNPAITPTDLCGVYGGSTATRNYYNYATYRQNEATVTLTANTPLSAGASGPTYIEAGWSLRLGKIGPGDFASPATPGAGDYTSTLANCTGFYIDSGMATAIGYNVDGVQQTSTSHQSFPLAGSLIVDNQSTNLTLPPLFGSGNFVEMGQATITVNPSNFRGALYLSHGTLKLASGSSLRNTTGLYMVCNDPTLFLSTFDLSLASPQSPSWASRSGIIVPALIGTQSMGSADNTSPSSIYVPVITLGNNNVIIGNNNGASSSKFEGKIQGAGGLEIAPQTSLRLGGIVESNNTYTGDTYIDNQGTLSLSTFPQYRTGQPYNMIGTGNLFNNGTLKTTSGMPQLGLAYDSTMVPQDGAMAGANHIIYVNGNYTQGSTGNLQMNINSNSINSLPTGTITPATGRISSATGSPDVLTATAHGLNSGDKVLISGATGDATINGQWYVVNPTTNTFEISATSGGGALNSGGKYTTNSATFTRVNPFDNLLGVVSDYLQVVGNVTLASGCHLTLNDVNSVPLSGPTTVTLVSGKISSGSVFALPNGTLLTEGTTFQLGHNAATIHYLSNSIVLALSPLTIVLPDVSPQANVGTSFNFQISQNFSANQFTASGLPSGLSLNASTGLVSGVPMSAGFFPVSITATNISTDTTVSTEFTLIISETFSQWETSHGVTVSTSLNDDVPDLLKYLCDIDPTSPMNASSRAALPKVGMVTTNDTQYLTLIFRQYIALEGITVEVQTSNDLQSWTPVTGPALIQTATDPNTKDPIMQAKVLITNDPQFIRLHISEQ